MALGPDIVLDPLTGDLDLTGGDLKMRADFAQAVGIRLRFFLGEWFLDITKGIAYYERILVKAPIISHVAAIFRQVIVETPGFQTLSRFDFDYDPRLRKFTLTWKAETDQGEISDVEVL